MHQGNFGEYGGQYMPEVLMEEILNIERYYDKLKKDPDFLNEIKEYNRKYTGRPSLLYYAENVTKQLQGPRVYLKREDLNHTGSHKINNCIGQALLAKRMGKTRIIAETGAGQHGVAAATVAALFHMECEVFMGAEDVKRQAMNVYRMKMLGAKVHSVTSGTKTLKDAVNEVIQEWTKRVDDTYYLIGSTMGSHPYPTMVRDFQSIISKECIEQLKDYNEENLKAVYACVGGGSNAMGAFYHFINNPNVSLIGAEAAGEGIETGKHAATMTLGKDGIFHGMRSLFLQDHGNIAPVFSISAGLDYPGIGPEHAYLKKINRAKYVPITDIEAIEALEFLCRTEGIIPAIESAHAVAALLKDKDQYQKEDAVIICLSGRGDKDVRSIANYRGVDLNETNEE